MAVGRQILTTIRFKHIVNDTGIKLPSLFKPENSKSYELFCLEECCKFLFQRQTDSRKILLNIIHVNM